MPTKYPLRLWRPLKFDVLERSRASEAPQGPQAGFVIRNVRWRRQMLSPGESQWVCWRDRQTDGRQTVTSRFLLDAASVIIKTKNNTTTRRTIGHWPSSVSKARFFVLIYDRSCTQTSHTLTIDFVGNGWLLRNVMAVVQTFVLARFASARTLRSELTRYVRNISWCRSTDSTGYAIVRN